MLYESSLTVSSYLQIRLYSREPVCNFHIVHQSNKNELKITTVTYPKMGPYRVSKNDLQYTRQQDFFLLFSINTIHCHIVHNFDFYIHLALTGIINFQNQTFLIKVMPCFINLEKSEF